MSDTPTLFTRWDALRETIVIKTCPNCGGTGTWPRADSRWANSGGDGTCARCDGVGTIQEREP